MEASASDSTSTNLPLVGHVSQKNLYYIGAATGAAALGFGVWWLTRESYYSYVPPQARLFPLSRDFDHIVSTASYQYRPGTFTGWIAQALASHAKRRRSRRPIRVYMDGCFDMMHYGHANALRQARALGDQLVVGLVPDSEILRCKGPPILNEKERLTLVESVKWVDEVITGVPYDLTPEFLQELIHKHKIDYIIHGDDPCIMPDGTDAYAHAKKLGRFRMIKRTEGVSTTDIVGRMLMCSRDNARFAEDQTKALTREFSISSEILGTSPSHIRTSELAALLENEDDTEEVSSSNTRTPKPNKQDAESDAKPSTSGEASPETHQAVRFMPTSRRIVQFSSGKMVPPGAKVVYIDGAFDLFHVGHVEILKLARQQGDFLLVGVHTDEDITERRGPYTPIMGLHERALSVLACKYADEVIIGAPVILSEDMLTTFGIELVVRGTVHEGDEGDSENERYKIAREKGILKMLKSPTSITSATVIHRIVENRALFEARQKKKAAAEADYYKKDKQYINEI